MDQSLYERGMVRYGMHFAGWRARIPGTDIVAPMLQITSPAEDSRWRDPEVLADHQVSLWMFDEDGAPVSLASMFREAVGWKADRRRLRISTAARQVFINEGACFGIQEITADAIVLDRRKGGAS